MKHSIENSINLVIKAADEKKKNFYAQLTFGQRLIWCNNRKRIECVKKCILCSYHGVYLININAIIYYYNKSYYCRCLNVKLLHSGNFEIR